MATVTPKSPSNSPSNSLLLPEKCGIVYGGGRRVGRSSQVERALIRQKIPRSFSKPRLGFRLDGLTPSTSTDA